MKRAIVIVMDSVGIGELPDAYKYGDEGSNTLGNIAARVSGFRLPNLQKLGLGNIGEIKGVEALDNPSGCFGKMAEKSAGKDTTSGHWEISGIIKEEPFPVYPHGFPAEIIDEFEIRTGRKVLGNYAASGTKIIEDLGEMHIKTKRPIVYTSADSVFQIAAHEDVIPVEELYRICSIAREILKGEHAVGRVIARPFTGEPGSFVRTSRRRDFSLDPLGVTMLDVLKSNGYRVMGVGKIEDIFNGRGITDAVHTINNDDSMDKTIEYMKNKAEGLIFTNCVDFDMVYGHRNNVEGYAEALMNFDSRIPDIMESLQKDDILIITADHGCDPTTESTDHSREYVPLLVAGLSLKAGVNLGVRETFADIAATVLDYFGIKNDINGTSFLYEVKK
ncbi:MAG TPA: phosphopentomutase [Clostridiaceae bacterium]|nr:phosphopentomutase [Clostridiaceae bacterium]